MNYFVLKGHDTEGPFSEEDLRRGFAGMRLDATVLVRPEDERHWTPLRKLLDHLDDADFVPEPVVAESQPAPVIELPAPTVRSGGLVEWIGGNPIMAGLLGVARIRTSPLMSR